MKTDILKHTILNTVKSLSFWMKKPERKFIRTILENMLEYKTTVLSKMWDTDKKSAKELKNYYSFNLWKWEWNDLWKKVEKITPFLKKKGVTLNRNSITSFISYYMKFIRKMKFYFWNNTVKQHYSWQLSLY